MDVEMPRFRAAMASEAAGLGSSSLVRKWRQAGMSLGRHMKGKGGGWTFSLLDVAELSTIYALNAIGLPIKDAIARGHGERRKLRDLLIARLEMGYWPLAAAS